MSSYDDFRTSQNEYGRERSKQGREIGPLPPPVNRSRRDSCRHSFKLFCETYFPARFDKPWGRDHLEVLNIIQQVITVGGQFPLAMPRGSGKTTLATCAAIYALLYGYRRFVVFIGSTATVAQSRLDELIRDEFELNDLLADDFPEVCFPVRALERNTVRAKMQTLDGEFTMMGWGQGELKLPTVPGSVCSGARVACAGLASGDVRGLLKRAPDGTLDRPDLVICDDPQTDESARMPGQVTTREILLNGAVLGLAGPGKKIAVVVPCTVIRPNDLSARLLDRKRNPEWQGRKFKLLDTMPSNTALWEKYGDLLRDGMQYDPPDRKQATEFYRANQAAMDEGASLSWPARFDPEQLSAVQFAMDLYILKPAVFAAEYQNEPLSSLDTNGADPVDPVSVMQKVNRVPRLTVPTECSRLTAFIDPKQEIMYGKVVAWDNRFGGSVIDYTTFPKQHSAMFSGTNPSPSISDAYRQKGFALEGRLYAALTAIADEMMGRSYPRADGGEPMRVELCLVDCGWGPYAELIHKWCRESKYSATIKASKGSYVGAAKGPFSEWSHKPGDRRGTGWRIRVAGTNLGRLVNFDTNFWKTFIAERLRTEMGSPGCLSLYGSSPQTHKLLADHLSSEHPVRITVDGRTVDEWVWNDGRPDNDWFDCLVGCAVAASICGLQWQAAEGAGMESPKADVPKRIKLSELQAAKRAAGVHRV